MNKQKFDGPSFVNPSHTSYNLDSGQNYQIPKVNYQTEKEKNAEKPNGSKPRGGWDDDEIETKMITTKKKESYKNYISAVEQKNKNEEININVKSNQYVNYWDAENTRKIQQSTLSIEYETKLIDDILKPTGVTIKPSDLQIKEFLKKLKSLNKDIVLKILFERFKNFENMSDVNGIKILTRALYLITPIINEKIEGFKIYFQENQQIFADIQNYYSSNKKIFELVNEIFSELNGQLSGKNEKNKSNVCLVNLKEKDNPDKIVYNSELKNEETKSNSDKNSVVSQENKKVNFIKKKVNKEANEEIEFNNGNNVTYSNESTKSNNLFENLKSKVPEEKITPKFDFIKSKKTQSGNQITTITNVEKEKDNSNLKGLDINLLSQELNKVFTETTNTYPMNDIQNSMSGNINSSIFTINNNLNNSNYNNVPNYLNQINSQNNQNIVNNIQNKKDYPASFDLLFDPAILYSGNSTFTTKIEEPKTAPKKDHFDFVNDLMKPKK